MEKKIFLPLIIALSLATGYLGYTLYTTKSEQKYICERIERLQERQEAVKQPATMSSESEKKSLNWTTIQAQLRNTVVQILVQVAQLNWLEPYKTPNQGGCSGTGFFINEQGYIITNAHVVNQATAVSIQVPEFGKELLDAEIVCVAPERDLALLKLKPTAIKRFHERLGKIPFVELGDSNTVRRADEIMTLGYPLGQQGLKSTTGVVSGRENEIGRNMIQIDAPINPGNSGGPAFDSNGKVIGINTSGIIAAQNVGYIIPVNELKLIMDGLFNSTDGLLRKPYLGILLNAGSAALTEFLGNPHPGGYYITGVYKNGLGNKAGIQEGDMIYEIDGHRVDLYGQINLEWSEDKISFTDYVSSLPLGHEINLMFYRGGKRMTTTFNFDQSTLPPIRIIYPEFEMVDYEVIAGMVIMELRRNHLPLLINDAPELIVYEDPRNQLKSTLVITHILPDSVAQRSRLIAPGQRLNEINGVTVNTLEELRKAVEKSVSNDFLRVKLANSYFTVFPLQQILEDEVRLSPIYHYPISSTIEKIMRMKAYHANIQKNATGSSSEADASGVEQNAHQ